MTSFPPVDVRYDVGHTEVMKVFDGLIRPTIFKGLVADWPAVAEARKSAAALIDYLKARDTGKPAETFRQAPGVDGKFFYDEAMKGLNFQRAAVPLAMTLERLRGNPEEHIYIQSAPLRLFMPRFAEENRMAGVPGDPRIWIGNRSLTQTHFDINYNLVCMIGGRKRFVLFPPDQTSNLYMGPIETTVSGVPTSMASLENPDFEAHPRFAEALKHAVSADLEPGDALFVPYMWWHHVSSSESLNVQVNYWWNTVGPQMGAPMHALLHAIVSLRDLPPDQNAAWKAMFDQFVFHQGSDPGAHLPEALRGILGVIPDDQRKLIFKSMGRNLQD